MLILMAILLVCTPGCLRRRLTVKSNPPGAMVYVDEHPLGRTPISTDFTYYGKRNIRLELDNYQTLNVQQPIHAPWYEWPVMDFISENFCPYEIKDHHTLSYTLTPNMESSVTHEQIMLNAAEIRQDAQRRTDASGNLLPPGYEVPQGSSVPVRIDPEPSIPRDLPKQETQTVTTESVPTTQTYPQTNSPLPDGPEYATPTDVPTGVQTWDGPPRYPPPSY